MLLTAPGFADKSACLCNGDMRNEKPPVPTFLKYQPGRPEVLQGGSTGGTRYNTSKGSACWQPAIVVGVECSLPTCFDMKHLVDRALTCSYQTDQ